MKPRKKALKIWPQRQREQASERDAAGGKYKDEGEKKEEEEKRRVLRARVQGA